MSNTILLSADVMQNACLFRSILLSTGAFLLGMGLFWLLFAKKWLTELQAARLDIQQLQERLNRLKQQETSAFAKNLAQRKPAKAEQSKYSQLFGPSNFQFFTEMDEAKQAVLKAKGLLEWKDIANIPVDQLKLVLEEGQLPTPQETLETWRQQAVWALSDNWQALEVFQREWADKKSLQRTPLERATITLLGFSDDPQNLCIVEGIDQDMQRLLNQAGIQSWQDLAAADITKLNTVFSSKAIRPKEIATWSRQALLAIEGKWMELSNYQDQLHQSSDPGISR